MSMHYYDVLTTKTGEVTWNNGNHGCFAEYTNGGYRTMFQKENTLRVYFPKEDVHLEEDLIKRWCKYLCHIGLNVKMQKVDSLNRKLLPAKGKSYWNPIELMMPGYIFDFDMAKYKSSTHLKVALHIWRHCYEGTMYIPLKEAFRLKGEYPKASILELLQFSYMYERPTEGHTMIYCNKNSIVDIKSAIDLKAEIKKQGDTYNAGFVQGFFTKLGGTWGAEIRMKDINLDEDTYKNPIIYKKKIKEWHQRKAVPQMSGSSM